MDDERTPPLYRALHAVARPLLHRLWRPTIEGREHVPDEGPAILCANHLSFIDSVFVPAALERPVFYLGKSDYFTGWQRLFFENVGVMPVAREGGDAGEASLRRGQEILESGRVLGIYPEGTRSGDGRLYRGKTGPVRLAARTGAPIIPVGLIGTREIMPPEARLPKVGHVVVRFGRPLDLRRLRGRDTDRFALRSATDELMYEIGQLSGQQYVDAYAADVKAGTVDLAALRVDELGQVSHDELRPTG